MSDIQPKRGPGRPRREDADTDEQKAVPMSERAPRVPLGGRQRKLAVPTDDKENHYRWVNDSEDGERIRTFKAAWYEPTGQSRHVGVTAEGKSLRAHLMRIPKEYHAEDRAKRHATVDAIEGEMEQQSGKFGLDAEDQHAATGYTQLERGHPPDTR